MDPSADETLLRAWGVENGDKIPQWQKLLLKAALPVLKSFLHKVRDGHTVNCMYDSVYNTTVYYSYVLMPGARLDSRGRPREHEEGQGGDPEGGGEAPVRREEVPAGD